MRLRKLTFALLLACGLAASAANEKTTVTQVTDAVQLTADVDYIITGDTPFAITGSVDIQNTEHAVLIIASIKPSLVLKNWMNNIYINGEKAVDGTNCQVKMYGRGAIVFPYTKDIQPLTCYTEQNFEGDACSNYSEGHTGGYMKTLNAATLNNQIRSFKLKRGYMVTFAIGTGGWGYSRCFIADQEDLEVKTLPSILDKRISSYRIFKWVNAHKAGLASNGNYEANQALNTSWCYDWAQGNASNMPDTEWVPNHIYEDYPSSATCGSVTASCHMKTNNEPGNSADDHPQDVATVLANWQNLMRTGMRLCSESSHDGSMGHLKEFIDSIDARGWRCDILDLHCYWDGGFDNLNWYSDHYGKGRPIWISEWIWGASWNHNGAFADGRNDAEIISHTKEILNTLNANPRVERYAYWNSEGKAHIYEGGGLTELGQYYATMDVGLGYNAANEYIPQATRLEYLSSLSGEYNKKKGVAALTWTDPNGDLMTTITVQCKLPEASTWTNIADITPKDKNAANGVTYTYEDEISEPGVYTYRIKATSYLKKTYTTNEALIQVAPAQGNNVLQYGKLTIDSADGQDISYTETLTAVPCVFVGAITNSNGNFYAGNVTAATGDKAHFTFAFCPWQGKTNTFNKTEELPFMAVVPGNYKCGDLDCEVGEVNSEKASTNNWTDETEVTFTKPFPEGVTPVVLTEIRKPSYATASSKATSLSVRVFDVTNTGFKFIIYSEEASQRKIALSQTVCYLAITPGYGTLDADNGILIAAGHGVDTPIYGLSPRENNFYCQVFNEKEGTTTNELLYLKNPTVFAALQTNNYPAATMLRRTNIKTKDDEEIEWVTGIKVKRLLDHDITVDGTTIPATSTADMYSTYRDNVGWVAITSSIKGYTPESTAIHATKANQQGQFTPRLVNGRVQVDGASTFEVYHITGAKVPNNAVLTPGIYVIKANGKSGKLLVK